MDAIHSHDNNFNRPYPSQYGADFDHSKTDRKRVISAFNPLVNGEKRRRIGKDMAGSSSNHEIVGGPFCLLLIRGRYCLHLCRFPLLLY